MPDARRGALLGSRQQLEQEFPAPNFEPLIRRSHETEAFSAARSLRGKTTTATALVPTVAGVASLRGDNLTLAIGDLDESFRGRIQPKLRLIDVGVFFLPAEWLGPSQRATHFARIFQRKAGTTTIRRLVSEWQVEHGVAQARDVAMATQENRIALKGGLDFVSGRDDEVTVAGIDAKGCAGVQQQVHGSSMNPVVEKPSVMGMLTGPTRRLLRQAEESVRREVRLVLRGFVRAVEMIRGAATRRVVLSRLCPRTSSLRLCSGFRSIVWRCASACVCAWCCRPGVGSVRASDATKDLSQRTLPHRQYRGPESGLRPRIHIYV